MTSKQFKCRWCHNIDGENYGKAANGVYACSICADKIDGKIVHKEDYQLNSLHPFCLSKKEDNK